MKTKAEIEWNSKYGKMTEAEREELVASGLAEKLGAYRKKASEAKQTQKAKYDLPYGEYAKKIRACKKRIAELEASSTSEKLLQAERERLSKEYDHAKERDYILHDNKEVWISGELAKYMLNNAEYLASKRELQELRNDLDIYIYKKAKWEKDHDELIRSEILRTQRAELLSADEETLAELGIKKPKEAEMVQAPAPIDTDLVEKMEMLRSIHPSATYKELLGMAKSI